MNSPQSIQIDVTSRYLKEQSDPAARRFAFAYTVEITNTGSVTVQLLNRHWFISDDDNQVEEVQGEGVVGKQPQIAPGETFSYTSGAVIQSEVGTMRGSYGMIAEDGTRFDAEISPFLLAMPHTVH